MCLSQQRSDLTQGSYSREDVQHWGVDIFTLYLLTLYLDSIKSSKGLGEGMGQEGREGMDFEFNLETNRNILLFLFSKMGKKVLGFK